MEELEEFDQLWRHSDCTSVVPQFVHGSANNVARIPAYPEWPEKGVTGTRTTPRENHVDQIETRRFTLKVAVVE